MSCMAPGCDTSFSLFSRKHRCRICGKIFCSSCCASTTLLPYTAPSTGEDGTSSALNLSRTDAGRSGSNGAIETTTSTGERFTFQNGVMYTQEKVCNSCNYELQLVVSTRSEKGELRRKSRGELKYFQRALIVNIMSFLTLRDLAEISAVSSDFYFMSRDNLIWYQYNMTRWMKDSEFSSVESLAKAQLDKKRFKHLVQNNTAQTSSEGDSTKRVISLHARYNYTQFLDFARRQEMARSNGFSSFSIGSRILLSSPIKIAVIGPSKVGKTACIRSFLGENPYTMVVQPTVGFVRYTRSVTMPGAPTGEITCHIFDISGESRYEALRKLICSQCHVIGLCYDPHRKVTLVEAADVMVGVEPILGPQSVVVCGLIQPAASSTERDDRRKVRNDDELGVRRGSTGGTPLAGIPHTASFSSFTPADAEEFRPTSHSAPATPTESHLIVSESTRRQMAEVDQQIQLKTAQKTAEVTKEDASGVTGRGGGSLQCPLLETAPFFSLLIQCLLDSLALGTMATTGTVADLTEELSKSSTSQRRPRANRTVAEELLNLTMQPSALDVMLDKK
ncbi:ras-like small GTPase [Angomonas deanei]|nr:ras-like small GTPase [Angomonas deanei]|eukprot:EPY19565.1 ras-like small GTPase [Angomonas deanei]